MKYSRNMLSNGRYLANCIAAVEKLSQSGSEMIEMRWKIEDNGSVVEVRSFLTPKMGWIIDQLKKAIGMDLGADKESNITPSDLIGAWALVDIECQEYKGQVNNSITKYSVYEGQIPENVKEEEVPF